MFTFFNLLFKIVPFHQQLTNILQDVFIGILRTGPIPTHVAFVMDGNRRFAKSKGLALKDGHAAGAETLISVLDTCYKLGVKAVTIYAFSIENFNRPQSEVDTLFALLREKLQFLASADEYADKNKVKVKIIGNKTYIPDDILKDLNEVERLTKDNDRHLLNVCFPYTSRDDMTHAIKKVVREVSVEHKYEVGEIDEHLLNRSMYFGEEYPDVDILIRTSGHTRLSDFMLWQTNKNSVIIFDNTLWPDFKSFNLMTHIVKWSYYKTLLIKEAEMLQLRNPKRKGTSIKDLKHPPYASVTGN